MGSFITIDDIIRMNEPIKHSEMVTLLVKPGKALVDHMTPKRASLLHMAVGISGEAGELLDTVKKLAFYNQSLDNEKHQNLIEELGDLEFYMEGIRQVLGLTREEILTANMTKLAIRYKDFKYSDQSAKDRLDKV